jgi:hypothetical protein
MKLSQPQTFPLVESNTKNALICERGTTITTHNNGP